MRIPKSSAITGNKVTGRQIPAIARPLPLNFWGDLFIFTNATIPRIIAGRAVIIQEKGLRIPRINAAVADLAVLGAETCTRGAECVKA